VYLAKFGNIQNMKVKKILNTLSYCTQLRQYFPDSFIKIFLFFRQKNFKKGNLCENIPLPETLCAFWAKAEKFTTKQKSPDPYGN
jgi:hypothetical protein